MQEKENIIELKVGDKFRFNRARKHYMVMHMFDYEGETYVIICSIEDRRSIEIKTKERLCGIYNLYGNIYDGIVEVNGYQVRGTGGKLLATPKPVKQKVEKPKPEKKELTDFQKFLNVQRSGKINMTDSFAGSRLAGISIEKYEDILFNYDDYKAGKRQ